MNSSNRHLRFGWWSLFAFIVLGLVLETLHGFKVSWYLDVGSEVRRLMFTLAHAHGTLLALVNIAAGLTLRSVKGLDPGRWSLQALLWGSMVTPAGFFLGGITIHAGDPGIGIILVPFGAALLLYGVGSTARALSSVTTID